MFTCTAVGSPWWWIPPLCRWPGISRWALPAFITSIVLHGDLENLVDRHGKERVTVNPDLLWGVGASEWTSGKCLWALLSLFLAHVPACHMSYTSVIQNPDERCDLHSLYSISALGHTQRTHEIRFKSLCCPSFPTSQAMCFSLASGDVARLLHLREKAPLQDIIFSGSRRAHWRWEIQLLFHVCILCTSKHDILTEQPWGQTWALLPKD